MTTQELAYTEIEKLVRSFKSLPAPQLNTMNEIQTRLGYILPLFGALVWNINNIVSQMFELMDTLAIDS